MKLNAPKLFLISTTLSVAVVVIACMFWTEFEILEVANIMFWVGALTIVIGGGFFISIHNKYHGQSVAIMTTLKHHVPEDEHTLKIKEKRNSRRIVSGLAVAAPGVMLIIISWLIFANS